MNTKEHDQGCDAGYACDHDSTNLTMKQSYDPMEHCGWCDTNYDANAQGIHCPHNKKPPQVSAREKIATEIERMYGPHDRRFKTAIEIADAIRAGAKP